jgi:hypothetical protein
LLDESSAPSNPREVFFCFVTDSRPRRHGPEYVFDLGEELFVGEGHDQSILCNLTTPHKLRPEARSRK